MIHSQEGFDHLLIADHFRGRTLGNLPSRIEDNNPVVWTDLGVMYRRDGQPLKAIEAFDKAMTLDPLHEVSRFNKGIVLMYDLNDPKGAVAAWESLLAINPGAKAQNGQSLRDLIERVKRGEP